MISDRERRLLRVVRARIDQAMIDRALDRLEEEIRTKDASGHEHVGAGSSKGGQFGSGGGGGSGEQTHGRKPRQPRKPGEKPEGQEQKPHEPKPEKKAKPIRGDMAEARREGKGKDAKIVMADGKPAPGHITPSMVPPQWTNVKVSTDPRTEVLVTARDAKGRPKMVTSKSYDARSAAIKFGRVNEMIKEHDKISNQIQEARKDPAKKEEADCAWLMQVQATRPGSNADTKAKVKAYGATTLEARHVIETKEGVRLKFIGKEGIAHDHLIRDEKLAKMLLDRKNAASSDTDTIFKTDDNKVREFTASLNGGKFTPKDFRTSAATRLASDMVKENPHPTANAKEYKARVMQVATAVSSLLGNRPAQALQSYIHPAVFSHWGA